MIVECDLIEIETYAFGAGLDDHVRKWDMAFKFGKITIRVIMVDPLCIVNHAH
jgi:hypothetical protein